MVYCLLCKRVKTYDVRKLPCSHAFCMSCLKDRVFSDKDAKSVQCPSCKEESAVSSPPGELPRAQPRPCHRKHCLTDALFTCSTCDVTLCAICADDHRLKKRFAKHVVAPISDAAGFYDCPMHRKSVSFVCFRCDHLGCPDCRPAHRGHTAGSVGYAASFVRSDLVKMLRLSDQRQAGRPRSFRLQNLARVETIIQTLGADVRKYFARWRKEVDKAEKYFLDIIAARMKTVKVMRSKQVKLNKVSEPYNACREEVERLLALSSDVTMCRLGFDLSDNYHKCDYDYAKAADFLFDPESKVVDAASRFVAKPLPTSHQDFGNLNMEYFSPYEVLETRKEKKRNADKNKGTGLQARSKNSKERNGSNSRKNSASPEPNETIPPHHTEDTELDTSADLTQEEVLVDDDVTATDSAGDAAQPPDDVTPSSSPVESNDVTTRDAMIDEPAAEPADTHGADATDSPVSHDDADLCYVSDDEDYYVSDEDDYASVLEDPPPVTQLSPVARRARPTDVTEPGARHTVVSDHEAAVIEPETGDSVHTDSGPVKVTARYEGHSQMVGAGEAGDSAPSNRWNQLTLPSGNDCGNDAVSVACSDAVCLPDNRSVCSEDVVSAAGPSEGKPAPDWALGFERVSVDLSTGCVTLRACAAGVLVYYDTSCRASLAVFTPQEDELDYAFNREVHDRLPDAALDDVTLQDVRRYVRQMWATYRAHAQSEA